MPFTLAHPAAILPFRRWPLMTTIPLIIGSLSPDLATLLPWRLMDRHGIALPPTHSVAGTLVVDLPFGIMLLCLLVWLRTPLTAPLWQPHRGFVKQAVVELYATRRWWLAAIPGLILGSWTHILWDSFTHQNRFMVRKLPWLNIHLFPDSAHPMALYHALQYACSAAGLLLIAWWYFSSLKASGLHGTGRVWRKYLLAVIGLVALLAGVLKLLAIRRYLHALPFYFSAATVLGTAIPAFASCYLLAGLVLTRFRPDRTSAATSTEQS